MATATATPTRSQFAVLADEALQRYRELVIEAAEGAEIDPTQAIDTALGAGRSLFQLQQDVERATARYHLHVERQSLDYESQIQTALQDSRDATAALEAARLAETAARKALSDARAQSSAATSRSTRLQQERTDSAKKFSAAMKATAGDERDYTSWKNFALVS